MLCHVMSFCVLLCGALQRSFMLCMRLSFMYAREGEREREKYEIYIYNVEIEIYIFSHLDTDGSTD